MSSTDAKVSTHTNGSRYKDKFNSLREVYTRVTAARQSHEKDLESAGTIMKRLQDEIDLLLDALSEVQAQEELMRREHLPEREDAYSISTPSRR